MQEPSILATLWSVDDRSTSILMKHFYENGEQGMSKPEALKQAQITLNSNHDYKHPYCCAPFVMIRDWRSWNFSWVTIVLRINHKE